MNDAKELQEIYTLLTENYVEDDDPEGLPGCGQLWWTRVSFGGLYHPIWENFSFFSCRCCRPSLGLKFDLGNGEIGSKKTGQHVPL